MHLHFLLNLLMLVACQLHDFLEISSFAFAMALGGLLQFFGVKHHGPLTQAPLPAQLADAGRKCAA